MERARSALSFREMVSSTASCSRAARLTEIFSSAAMSRAAESSCRLRMPDATEGYAMPDRRTMIVTTIIISIRVTPARLLRAPAFDIGIVAFTPRLAVGAIGGDVRLISVLSGIFVNVRMVPRIGGNVAIRVRPFPSLHPFRFRVQRLQSLLCAGERAHLQLVELQLLAE